MILVLSVQHLAKKKTNVGLYDTVETPLKIFQSAAILEVIWQKPTLGIKHLMTGPTGFVSLKPSSMFPEVKLRRTFHVDNHFHVQH